MSSASSTITITNAGPNDAPGARVSDSLPAALTGATWTCSVTAGSSCTGSGPGSIDDTVARLCAIKGIGVWTAHYIALRVVREPDAFPESDIGILRGATPAGGARPTPQALLQMAENWRPWRTYAAQHLWAADEALIAAKARA